ncbi:hypothetical protein NDU88_003717 [Pleurodeles waltl]|uniref:DDE Tnp4 domain-containing protein n=1 Tax=Pleurodeles waltl TaxID=8319 RepID=A0AAV7VGT4_PLEWA|nr:hypothetical protein NDU88_003717 [Pleurodeles waltl]
MVRFAEIGRLRMQNRGLQCMKGIRRPKTRNRKNWEFLRSDMILRDSAYAARTYMMTPYLNPATPAERRYNSAHKATRNVVERTFGLLKSRF